MAVHVNLNARILPEDHRAFLARPGKSYGHLPHFEKLGAIGPDLPFMKLERGVPIEEQLDMAHMLKRAVAYRKWFVHPRGEQPPPQELEYYRDQSRVRNRTARQYEAAMKGYFEVAKKDDLVLVPTFNWRSSSPLVEFSSGPGNLVYRDIPYRETMVTLPLRKFNMITKAEERLLSSHILDIAQKPNIFVQFPKSNLMDLYDIAYPSFSKPDECSNTFAVKSTDYNLEHDLHFGAFIRFVAANFKALEEGAKRPYSIEESIFGDFGEYTPKL